MRAPMINPANQASMTRKTWSPPYSVTSQLTMPEPEIPERAYQNQEGETIMPENNTKKRVVISAGPIPARLDPVKFITNKFKGGLALKTAAYLAAQPDFEVTLVMWKGAAQSTPATQLPSRLKTLVKVQDVFEYYDWFVANAKNYDAFIMAAAVANLTPVKPYDQKFPSHLYKPGEEFDIKFIIAPRAIDAIKPLNPRACLIGYKLYDEPDDYKLAEIARHTLADAKANLIFANHPMEVKHKKIAVTADGAVIPMDFEQHLDFMARAIRQEYFTTDIAPLTDAEKNDPDIREALAAVGMYENTFEKYGTVAIPVPNHKNMFATTSRGHKHEPVIVRAVDRENRRIIASGKATLNAPTLARILHKSGYNGIVSHRHFSDPLADDKYYENYAQRIMTGHVDPDQYIFPGTTDEYDKAGKIMIGCAETAWLQPYHGYLAFRPFQLIDWNEYNDQFPDHYFKPQPEMLELVRYFRENDRDVLEIGGNKHPVGNLSYDPYVVPESDTAKHVTDAELQGRVFPLVISFNAINYLSRAEIVKFITRAQAFAANTFRKAPDEKITSQEYAILDTYRHSDPVVRHGLRLPDDTLVRHRFRAYNEADYEAIGLHCWKYGRNSMVVYKNLGTHMGVTDLTKHAMENQD